MWFHEFFQQISANLHIFPCQGMSFILKICQIVAGVSTVHQFHDFLNLILGGFLTFGPTADRSWPPTLPHARAQLPHVDRGLPAAALSSALWPLSTLTNSSTVANRLTKDCYLATSGNQYFQQKSPCILTWFSRTFWRWGRRPRVIGLIVWTLWTTQHNRLCANQVAWPNSSSTISDYLLHTVCSVSYHEVLA